MKRHKDDIIKRLCDESNLMVTFIALCVHWVSLHQRQNFLPGNRVSGVRNGCSDSFIHSIVVELQKLFCQV